ncbi:hypothetical protein BPOR_0509g00010 [Botrytis porri]|uniref:Uncharacterized protein n=1 Tax=Botrytis porri TaxID=87229 RepID=A0A4Z1KLD5_9HELO|nr:hypothetical protein BPOR_0509g00010 [Botrytis porri]
MSYNYDGGDDLCWYTNQQVSLPIAISTSNDKESKQLRALKRPPRIRPPLNFKRNGPMKTANM